MKKKRMLLPLAAFAAGMLATSSPAFAAERTTHCPILDDTSAPFYEIGVGYIPEARFEEYGDAGVLEFNADWEFAYFRDIAYGDVDLKFKFRSSLFLDSTQLQLPDQVAVIAVDAGWTGRRSDGMAFQVRAQPGVYSDVEDLDADTLYMPVSCALIRTFDPQLAGIVGLQLRIGFDREIMPIIGVDWEIADFLELEARLPESRLICAFNREWTSELGLGWQDTSFSLREKGSFDRQQISLADFRWYWGLTHRASDDLLLSFEVGSVFNRQVRFKRDAEGSDLPRDIDPSNAAYVKFALGCPF